MESCAKMWALVQLVLLAACCSPLAAAPSGTGSSRTLSLGGSTKSPGGSPWTLCNANGSISVPATVPGVVHLDLLRAGKIAEPYYRYGELDLAWVYLDNWTYSRSIEPGALGAEPGRVLLRSEGLDTIATVILNGERIAETSNMFHRPVWDVTSVFRGSASNTLEIAFASPALASSANHDAYPYPVSGSYITPLQYPSCGCPDPAACFAEAKGCDCLIKCKHQDSATTRNFLRKSQAHWGWDWGAGFLTSGIYRELSLVSYTHAAVIRDVVVQVFPMSSSSPRSTSMVDMGLQPQQQADVTENPTSAVHAAPRDFRVELDVFLIADTMDAATTIVAAIPSLGARNSTKVSVAAGESKVAVIMELRDVPQSALWYPNGYGNAVLHNLTVTVGEPPSAQSSRWLTSELVSFFSFHEAPQISGARLESVMSALYPTVEANAMHTLISFAEALRIESTSTLSTL